MCVVAFCWYGRKSCDYPMITALMSRLLIVTSGYRSWYSISVCICRFVVYWVVIMIPILFCFSSSVSLFPLISEMILLITDPGDHNNSYPGCFPLSAIPFPSTTEILPPCVGQSGRWSQIETCWYTRLGWRYYIDKQVGHPAKYAERWKRDQFKGIIVIINITNTNAYGDCCFLPSRFPLRVIQSPLIFKIVLLISISYH